MLAHDNRIVHNDAQRDDEAEQRNDVNRQTRHIHEGDGGHHGDRNTCGDPKSSPRIQEQKEQDDHEAKPHQPAVNQDVQARANHFGAGADQLDRDAGWQGRLQLRRHIGNGRLHRNSIALVGAINTDRHGRVRPHEIGARAVDAFTRHGRHIPDPQL